MKQFCDDCGAVFDDEKSGICPYCGKKLRAESISEATVREIEETLKYTDDDETKEVLGNIAKTLSDKPVRPKKPLIVFLAVMVLLGIISSLFFARRADNDEQQMLYEMVQEVESLAAEGKYDAALAEANNIYFSGSSRSLKQKWEKKRLKTIERIEQFRALQPAGDDYGNSPEIPTNEFGLMY